MGERILTVQGHPDAGRAHLGHALAQAYADGAVDACHELRRVEVAGLDLPRLRSKSDWEQGKPPTGREQAQQPPLWLGGMPALLKGLLEQIARPGFALEVDGSSGKASKLLDGRSARLVVTMGMPVPRLSLALPRSQHQGPRAQHPLLRRVRADSGNPDRDGRGTR